MKRPIAVTIIAFLTLLSSLALAFLLLAVWVVSCVGMGGGIPLTVQNLPYYFSWLLPIFAFLFSVSILCGINSKYLWYGSVVFWIVLLLFFIEYYASTGIWHYAGYFEFGFLFLAFPFVYAVGCLVYFLTSTPKEYFHVHSDEATTERLESKTGGWLSIIGGILVILSIPFALYLMIERVSAEVGFTATMDTVLGVLRDEFPTVYMLIVTGIVINVIFGCLLIGFGGTFVGGRGSRAIAILMIIIGIFAIICSFAAIGAVVGLIGGVLGIIGGYMSRKQKVPPPLPPTDIQ